MTKDMEVMIALKLPRSLRDSFQEAAKRNDQTVSQELRKFIREYIKKTNAENGK